MANFPEDELPSEFDVVVDGTGLIQSIVAAALTRAGKTVLHLDANGYYGDHWASLMHRELQSWMNGDLSTFPEMPLDSDEYTVPFFPPKTKSLSNVIKIIPSQQDDPMVEASNQLGPPTDGSTDEQGPPTDGSTDQQGPPTDGSTDEQGPPTDGSTDEQGPPTDGSTDEQGPPTDGSTDEQGPPTDGSTDEQGPPTDKSTDEQGSPTTNSTDEQGPPTDGSTNEQGPPTDDSTDEQGPPTDDSTDKQAKGLLDWASLERQWRQFSFDLIPKVLYCRGAMVELLTQSNCARYVEFKAVGKIYRVCERLVEQVPCSRADLFSSEAVSMLEKRRMMKFLSFCTEFTTHSETIQEYADKPFEEFLQSRGLPHKIIDYIAHSIAMVGRRARTIDGLEATKIFLTSLGRFGNAPFLYPVFGVGELGQSFCRFCAVYGGVYCLRRSIAALAVRENRVEGVLCSTGQKIKTTAVVCCARLVRESLHITEQLREEVISRAVVVLDAPLTGTDGKVAVVTVPPLSTGPEQTFSVSVLQLDSSSNCCAPGTYLLHLVCVRSGPTAQSDLEPVLKTLLEKEGSPRILWALYFNLLLCHVTGPISTTPKRVFLTSDPDASLNYEKAVKEAQHLFEELCPGEEFLPTPPDPRDIVYDTQSSSGGDGQASDAPAGESESVAADSKQGSNEHESTNENTRSDESTNENTRSDESTNENTRSDESTNENTCSNSNE